MSNGPEDRGSDLRELFFETAAELLQQLNEEGLEMEQHPEDDEIIRHIRRTVHTLKGDSAACGFTELSELAHQLEDLLTPEMAEKHHDALAEIVLAAADTFGSMLSAYRGEVPPPSGEEVRQRILQLTGATVTQGEGPSVPAHFTWSEYEQMVIQDALSNGETVYYIGFGIDAHCPVRAAAMQLIRNVLNECGRLLAIVPDQSTIAANVSIVEAAVSSSHEPEWLEKKCRIPSVVSSLVVTAAAPMVEDSADDVLGLFRDDDSGPAEPRLRETAPAAPRAARENAATEPSPGQTDSGNAGGAFDTLLRVDTGKVDSLLNLVGELILAKSMLVQTVGEFDRRYPRDPLKVKFADALAFQARIINDLQKSVMKVRMVPVEQLFRRFPRVVRDLARSCGKEVALMLHGQETDLDKSILDMLAEPLTQVAIRIIA